MDFNQAMDYIRDNCLSPQKIICQADKDLGDSSNKVGVFLYFTKLQKIYRGYNGLPLAEEAELAFSQLEVSPGIFVRHPAKAGDLYPNGTPVQFYVYEPSEYSRDQQTPLVISMGEFPSQRPRLLRLFKTHASRFFKYQNKDIASPQHIGCYFRALRLWYTYPLLLITDLGLVVDSMLRVYYRWKDKEDTSNDVNNTMMNIQASQIMPTPISILARFIYKLANPQDAYDRYFKLESSAPPLNEIARPIIKDLL